jgi:hypothetical protein
MRRVFMFVVLSGIALSSNALAQVAGKWTGEQVGPGPRNPVVLEIKVTGSNLTGTYAMGSNPPVQISNGKVNGGKITFTTGQELRGNKIEQAWNGEVKGDELILTRGILVNGLTYRGRGYDQPVKLIRAK